MATTSTLDGITAIGIDSTADPIRGCVIAGDTAVGATARTNEGVDVVVSRLLDSLPQPAATVGIAVCVEPGLSADRYRTIQDRHKNTLQHPVLLIETPEAITRSQRRTTGQPHQPAGTDTAAYGAAIALIAR